MLFLDRLASIITVISKDRSMSHSHWIHLLCASWEILPSVHRAVFRLRISAAYLNLQSKSLKKKISKAEK